MSEAASFLFDRSIFTVNLLIICVLFLIPLEKRRRFPLRLAAGAALCIALSLLFPHTNLKYIVELAAAAENVTQAEEGAVLLTNSGGALPLSETDRVTVFGNGS